MTDLSDLTDATLALLDRAGRLSNEQYAQLGPAWHRNFGPAYRAASDQADVLLWAGEWDEICAHPACKRVLGHRYSRAAVVDAATATQAGDRISEADREALMAPWLEVVGGPARTVVAPVERPVVDVEPRGDAL